MVRTWRDIYCTRFLPLPFPAIHAFNSPFLRPELLSSGLGLFLLAFDFSLLRQSKREARSAKHLRWLVRHRPEPVEAGNRTVIHLIVLPVPTVHLDDCDFVTIAIGIRS
jgi:hypothetical protein